jgi:hypothetical protein
MSDWIGLGIIILLVVGGLCGLAALGKPYEVTPEEFEKRAGEGRGVLSAGVVGIQKLLDPGAEKAAAVQEDFRQGYLDGEQESGDGNDTDPASRVLNLSDKDESEESDA